MWVILDLSVVLIVLFFVFTSAKRGFVRTFVELVGFVLAIYIATLAGSTVAAAVYEKKVEPNVVSKITAAADEGTGNIANNIDSTWNTLPKAFTNAATYFGVNADTVANSVSSGLSQNADIATIAKNTSEKAVKPIVIPIVKSVVSLVLFTVLMFVVKVLARIINKAFKLPFIGSLNRILGGVIGLGKGIVVSMAICMLIGLFVALTGKGFWIFTKENIDQTYIFGIFANLKLL